MNKFKSILKEMGNPDIILNDIQAYKEFKKYIDTVKRSIQSVTFPNSGIFEDLVDTKMLKLEFEVIIYQYFFLSS